jgi:hypothetical protein
VLIAASLALSYRAAGKKVGAKNASLLRLFVFFSSFLPFLTFLTARLIFSFKTCWLTKDQRGKKVKKVKKVGAADVKVPPCI